jgi:hypothetical protein
VIIIDDEAVDTGIQNCPSHQSEATKHQCSSTQGPSKPPQKASELQLSTLDKWNVCAMWRKNKSLREIAQNLGTEEVLLHSYLYELIKKEAMQPKH